MSKDIQNKKITPEIIKKEDIPSLSFSGIDVLDDMKDKLQREIDLKRATTLSNMDKTKVKIYFRANQGIYRVHTTIWATTESNITLKGGVIIPISAVVRVI